MILKEREIDQRASQGVRNADQNRMEQPSIPDQPQIRPTGEAGQQVGGATETFGQAAIKAD